MTITLDKLDIAEFQVKQLTKVEKAGDFVGAKFTNLLTRAARQARKSGKQIKVPEKEVQKLVVGISKVAVMSYVQEVQRMKRQQGLRLSFYDTQRKVARQLNLDFGDIQNRFATLTGRPLRRSITKLTDKLNSAVRSVLTEGLSERKSAELLAIKLERLGLTTKTPSVIKTWIRTGASFAANAARWEVSQTDEQTWGYTYVTMQDDRVRPEHEKMEGYTRKKDDPIWQEIWPPNGWNCRCQIVVLTEPERQSRKNDSLVDGVSEGFEFNAGIDFLGPVSNMKAFELSVTMPSVINEITLVLEDTCGAGSPGGKGFEKGNTCQKGADAEREAQTKQRSKEKYDRVAELLRSSPSMQFDSSEEGTVLSLIHKTGLRPGSRRDTGAKKQAYGAVTLQGRHVHKTPDGVTLKFVGKKGVDLEIPIRSERMQKMLLARKKKAGSKGDLFSTTGRKLRAFSKEKKGYLPKDFRTAVGTNYAKELVKGGKKPKTFKEYKAKVKEVAVKVSKRLGNTPGVALQSYIDPRVFTSWKVAE